MYFGISLNLFVILTRRVRISVAALALLKGTASAVPWLPTVAVSNSRCFEAARLHRPPTVAVLKQRGFTGCQQSLF
jgi:hypothetical protein